MENITHTLICVCLHPFFGRKQLLGVWPCFLIFTFICGFTEWQVLRNGTIFLWTLAAVVYAALSSIRWQLADCGAPLSILQWHPVCSTAKFRSKTEASRHCCLSTCRMVFGTWSVSLITECLPSVLRSVIVEGSMVWWYLKASNSRCLYSI